MIVVANRFEVPEEHADEFVERFRESSGIEDQPGCLKFEFLSPIRADTYVSMTDWESMADFENWTESAHFRQTHADTPDEGPVTAESHLEIHEVTVERE